MKKKLLLIICLFTGLIIKAQTVKTYTGEYTVGSSNGTATYLYTEDPASGNRVFNGKFTYTGKDGSGKLLETVSGSYKNNLKDGFWIYNTKTVPGLRTISDKSFSGLYKDGFPNGIWKLNYVTKFVSGTQLAGQSLTGTSITITGTANYQNGHLVGAFDFDNKQTGNNIQPLSVHGSFDENGLMNGKWTIKLAAEMNGSIVEQTRDYKNGILMHKRYLDTKSGEAKNEDYSDNLQMLAGYDPVAGVYIFSDNQIYVADTVQADGDLSMEYALTTASNFFCQGKDEDHYHRNTKGCVDCSYFKKVVFNKVNNNQLATVAFRNKEYKKAAKIFGYLIKAAPNNAGQNYANLSWANCLAGNFQDNIAICKEGLKVAYGEQKNVILKNIGYSYLLTNQYDEAKKSLYNDDFKIEAGKLDEDLDALKNLGFHNPDCNKIKSDIKGMIEGQAAKQNQQKLDAEANASAEVKKKDETHKQSDNIDTMYQRFKEIYYVRKQVPFFVDQQGKPLMKDTYPKGENIFKKADGLLQPLIADYKGITDYNPKMDKGKYLTNLLNKLISLNDAEAKNLEKEMKKAVTNDDVKRVLGI